MADLEDDALLSTLRDHPDQLGEILESYRPRLKAMVRLRMDSRVRRRIDSSDVLQEAFAEVSTRLPRYLDRPDMPFYPWVRFITGQRLLKMHREHLQIQMRDVRREAHRAPRAFPEASSIALASALIDSAPSPSQAALRQEELERLRTALEGMKAIDREVLALRHFEGFTNTEVAQILDIDKKAASIRYVRALRRLGDTLGITYPRQDDSR